MTTRPSLEHLKPYQRQDVPGADIWTLADNLGVFLVRFPPHWTGPSETHAFIETIIPLTGFLVVTLDAQDVADPHADSRRPERHGRRVAEYHPAVEGVAPEDIGRAIGRQERLEIARKARFTIPPGTQHVLSSPSDGEIEAIVIISTDAAQREAQLSAERDEARAWVRRLTSERVLTCAFCGKAYPPGTPASNDASLTAHVRVCEKHPMREAEAEIERLRQEIKALRTWERDL